MFRVTFFLPPVVKPGRSRLRVPGQVLHVLQRHALRQQIGDRRHPERMRRQPRRQPGIFQPPLDQLANPLRCVSGFADSFRVRPFDARNNGESLASPAMPAAST